VVALFFAMLPVGLGLLLLLPVFSGAVYASYRDIFMGAEMRAQTLPPAAGWQWILRLRHLPAQPADAGMLVISYWFTVLFLNICR
jgi:uncharacterized membrane protein